MTIKHESDHFVLIMAGGTGTRLWPRSRSTVPKQFLSFTENGTMLQETVRRIQPLVYFNDLYVVTNASYADEIRRQLPTLPQENIFIEPRKRNTAAAVGLSAIYLKKENPQAVLSVLTADHIIKKDKHFRDLLRAAYLATKKHSWLLTIGIQPTYPSTGYGYIQSGEELAKIKKIPFFEVRSFKEKPDLPTAKAFVNSGKYFWNSGMFMFKVADILHSFKLYMPKLYKGLLEIEKAIGTPKEEEVKKKVFDGLDDVAIDIGVMEKAKNVVMVPGDLEWSDVGDWAAVKSIFGQNDKEGNLILGDHIGYDTVSTLVQSSGRLIATIGLSEMIVIDTEDVVFVCPQHRAQDVKKLVDILKKKKRKEYL